MPSKRPIHQRVRFRTGRTVRDRRPDLEPGRAYCPTCDKPVTVNGNGYLREHGRCGRVYVGLPMPAVAGPVPLTTPRVLVNDAAIRGVCRECGKQLYGDRTLCGACSVRLS